MNNRDSDYKVVLLTKAGVSHKKWKALERLNDTKGITVVGIIVEDLIHGSLPTFSANLLRKIIRHRGRGYPYRAFNAGRDIVRNVLSHISITRNDVDDSSSSPSECDLSSIPIIKVSDMLSDYAESQIKRFEPDLAIVWGTRILPRRIFEIPTDGSIGIHAGKIPEYRGGPAGFWEIYNGETRAGVTVQKLNEQLDAGKIVKQATVPIKPDDSPADVRDRQTEITVDLVVEAVRGISDGSLEPRNWDGSKGKVNTPPTIAELVRYWLRRNLRHR